MVRYLLRLDDACDTMDKDKWERVEKILDKNNTLPLIALIPNNNDDNMVKQSKIINFKDIIER